MPPHPVVFAFGLVRIHQCPVRKDVHEQLAAGPEAVGDARHQHAVVAHVLEHLHRHAAVERLRWQVDVVDVPGDDGDVADAEFARTGKDVFALPA